MVAPCISFAKLTFDCSVSHNNSVAIGFIIRDENGNPIMLASAKKSRSLSVPITEALFAKVCLLPFREELKRFKLKVIQNLSYVVFLEQFLFFGVSNVSSLI